MTPWLLHPCAGFRVTQRFGVNKAAYPPFKLRNGKMWDAGHEGIDFGTPPGTPIIAAHDGVVREVNRLAAWQRLARKLQPPYGNSVRLETRREGKRITTIYAHLDRVADDLKAGQVVRAGTVLGYSGNTGRVLAEPGYHLHFGLNFEDWPSDPAPFIIGGV